MLTMALPWFVVPCTSMSRTSPLRSGPAKNVSSIVEMAPAATQADLASLTQMAEDVVQQVKNPVPPPLDVVHLVPVPSKMAFQSAMELVLHQLFLAVQYAAMQAIPVPNKMTLQSAFKDLRQPIHLRQVYRRPQ